MSGISSISNSYAYPKLGIQNTSFDIKRAKAAILSYEEMRHLYHLARPSPFSNNSSTYGTKGHLLDIRL